MLQYISHVITRVKSELIVPRLFPPLCSKTKAAEGYVGGYKGKDTYDKTH